MQNRDSFDDPESNGVLAGIVRALDVRHHFAARGPFVAAGLVLATLAVLAAVMVYAYPREAAEQDIANTPIIRADATPYKMMPDDPGGMEIAHRDSVVFDTLRGDGGERRVENLLPESEEPVAKDELFAGLKTDIPATESTAVIDEPETMAPEAMAQEYEDVASYDETVRADAPAPAVADAAPAVAPVPTPAVKPAPVTAAADEPNGHDADNASRTEPAAGLPVSAKEAAIGTHFVQLGSVKDEGAAQAEWKKLQASFDGVLGGLNHRVQRADLGERGTFFRIQGGPVTEEEARQICQAVESKRPGGCLVVRP